MDVTQVKRAMAGDKASFSWLVTRHMTYVRRVLLVLIRCPADVDDLLQETFLQAYLNLHTLRDPQRFQTWVCGIGMNLARMRLRMLARRPSIGYDLMAHEAASTYLSPPQTIEQQEMVFQLNQAIAELPPSEREALWLVYGQGLSHKETAACLGTSLSAVKVRLYRGRHRLKAQLQNQISLKSFA